MKRQDKSSGAGCVSLGLNGCAILSALLAVVSFSTFLAASRGPADLNAILEAFKGTGYTPSLEDIRFAERLAPVLPLIAFGLFSMLAVGLRWLSGVLTQRPRDNWVRGLPQRLRGGDTDTFFLFLRAFKTTGALVSPVPPFSPLSVTDKLRSPHLQFEYALFRAVDPVAPVVCLGVPGEAVGVARILTQEATWQEMVQLLASHAHAIICIPSHRPGTLWEIEHLVKADLLSKTVFCMPPASARVNVAKEWQTCRESVKEIGLELPPYSVSGALFTLRSSGAVNRTRPLKSTSARVVRASLSEVLPLLGPG